MEGGSHLIAWVVGIPLKVDCSPGFVVILCLSGGDLEGGSHLIAWVVGTLW